MRRRDYERIKKRDKTNNPTFLLRFLSDIMKSQYKFSISQISWKYLRKTEVRW